LKKIRFIKGAAPPEYSITFLQNIYNEPAHRHLRGHEDWESFYILEDSKKLLLGQWHFHLEKDLANSGYRAPFGSVEFSERLELDELYDFIAFVETECRKRGILRICVANPPEIYDSFQFSRLANAFFQLGYRVEKSNLNAHIRVNEPVFENKLDKWELRKIRLAREDGYQGKRETGAQLEELYHVIETHWASLKASPPLTYGHLQDMLRLFPQRIKLFGLRNKKGQVVAAGIGLLVNENTLELILHGEIKASHNYNPATLLYEYIYSWCWTEGIKLLNLGIAPKKDLPNFKVIRFYHLIGAELSLKLTFEKELPAS
jgi:hypothetical protein